MTSQDRRKPGLGSPFLDAPLSAEPEGAARSLWPMRLETPYLGASILRRGSASTVPYAAATALTEDEAGIIGSGRRRIANWLRLLDNVA